MYCKKCGKEIDDKAIACPSCGCATDNYRQKNTRTTVTDPNDASSAGFAILCFFIPLIGLILFSVWNDTMPLKAKSSGRGALTGVIARIVFAVIYAVFYAVWLVASHK